MSALHRVTNQILTPRIFFHGVLSLIAVYISDSPNRSKENPVLKFSRYKLLAAAMLALSHSVPAAAVDEKVTTAADQKGIAVTIYNDNLALVKDARRSGWIATQPAGVA
jgi:hypothetical protein